MLFVEFCEVKGPNIRGIMPPDLNIPNFDLDKFRTRIVSIDLIGDPNSDSFPEDTWAIISVPEINAVSLLYVFVIRDFYARACIRTLMFCYTSFSRTKLMRNRTSLCACFRAIACTLQDNAQLAYIYAIDHWTEKFTVTAKCLKSLGKLIGEWIKEETLKCDPNGPEELPENAFRQNFLSEIDNWLKLNTPNEFNFSELFAQKNGMKLSDNGSVSGEIDNDKLNDNNVNVINCKEERNMEDSSDNVENSGEEDEDDKEITTESVVSNTTQNSNKKLEIELNYRKISENNINPLHQQAGYTTERKREMPELVIFENPSFKRFITRKIKEGAFKENTYKNENIWDEKTEWFNENIIKLLKSVLKNENNTTNIIIDIDTIKSSLQGNTKISAIEILCGFYKSIFIMLRACVRLYERITEAKAKTISLKSVEDKQLERTKASYDEDGGYNYDYYKRKADISPEDILPLVYSSPPPSKNINTERSKHEEKINADDETKGEEDKESDIISSVPLWVDTKSTNLVDIRELLSVDYVDLHEHNIPIGPYVEKIYSDKRNFLKSCAEEANDKKTEKKIVEDTPYVRCCRMLSSMRDYFSGDVASLLNVHSMGFSGNIYQNTSLVSTKYLCFGGIPTVSVGSSPIANAAISSVVPSFGSNKGLSVSTIPRTPIRFIPSMPALLIEKNRYVYGYIHGGEKENVEGNECEDEIEEDSSEKNFNTSSRGKISSVPSTLSEPVIASFDTLSLLRQGGSGTADINQEIEKLSTSVNGGISTVNNSLRSELNGRVSGIQRNTTLLQRVATLLLSGGTLVITSKANHNTSTKAAKDLYRSLLKGLLCSLSMFCCSIFYDQGFSSSVNIGEKQVLNSNPSVPPCPWIETDSLATVSALLFGTSSPQIIVCTEGLENRDRAYLNVTNRSSKNSSHVESYGESYDVEERKERQQTPSLPFSTDSRQIIFYMSIDVISSYDNENKNLSSGVSQSTSVTGNQNRVTDVQNATPRSRDSQEKLPRNNIEEEETVGGLLSSETGAQKTFSAVGSNNTKKGPNGLIFVRLVGPTCQYKGLTAAAKRKLENFVPTMQNYGSNTGRNSSMNAFENTHSQSPSQSGLKGANNVNESSSLVPKILGISPSITFPTSSSLCLHVHSELCRLSSICVCSLTSVLDKYATNSVDSHIALNIWKTSVSQGVSTNSRCALYGGRRIRQGRWDVGLRSSGAARLGSSTDLDTSLAGRSSATANALVGVLDSAVADGLIALNEPVVDELVSTVGDWGGLGE